MPTDRYRQGHHCAHNIYLGDEAVGHGQGADNAARLVTDANNGLDCDQLREQLAAMTAVARRYRDGWVDVVLVPADGGEPVPMWDVGGGAFEDEMTEAERQAVALLGPRPSKEAD